MGVTNLWPLIFLGLIPGIILLYILKRKYKEEEISSVLLWKEAYKNTIANTPWEKLKVNIIMILQILIVLMIIFSLMMPFLKFGGKEYKNLIVVLDNTASMSALYKDDKTRLEEAKEIAEDYIKSIKYDTNNIIIEYDGKSKFSERESIEKIKQSYGSGDINEIISYVRSMGESLEEYEVLVISDKSIDLGDINGRTICIGNNGLNAAITNISHKTEDNKVKVIATISNTGIGTYNGDFSLYNESQLIEVSSVNIKEGQSVTLNYVIDNVNGDYLKGELSCKDLISKDNVYYDVMKNNKESKILLVTEQNVFLEKALKAIENARVYKTNSLENASSDNYDLYVFDNITPKNMPEKGNILFINPENNEFFNVEEKNEAKEVNGQDEVLSKYTANMKFTVSAYKNINMPYYGKTIFKSENDIIGFIGDVNGRKIGALGFDIHNSDIALKKEFPILFYELGEKMTGSGILYKNNYKSSDEILIKGSPDSESIQVISPDNIINKADIGLQYSNLSELGIFKVKEKKNNGEILEEKFSINFPCESESSLKDKNLLNKDNVKKVSKLLRRGLSISPVILLLVLAGLILEYLLYLRGN